MKRLILAVLMGALLLNGCGTRVNVIQQSIGAEEIVPALKRDSARPVAFIRTVNLKSNDVSRPIGDHVLRHIRDKMRESGLFSEVTFQKPQGQPVTVNLSVQETEYRSELTNVNKGGHHGCYVIPPRPCPADTRRTSY